MAFMCRIRGQVNPKLTLTYGIRYEVYPAPYRDRTGASVLLPQLPQSANVEVGGINGNPRSAGIGAGWGQIVPRFGIAYRLNEKTVIRTGFGLTTDPDSMRYLRDSFPEDLAPSYGGTGNFTIAQDPANGSGMNLTYGIPNTAKMAPNYSTGFASLPVAGSTNTVPQHFRRGYIESWNLVVQRTLPAGFVGTVAYVGDHDVRQQVNINYLNAANFPTSSSALHAERAVQLRFRLYRSVQLQRQRDDQRRSALPSLLLRAPRKVPAITLAASRSICRSGARGTTGCRRS